MNDELQKLATAINGLKKPSLSVESGKRIKKFIKSGITEGESAKVNHDNISFLPSSLKILQKAIRRLSDRILPSSLARARMKEHIMSVVTNKSPKSGVFYNFRAVFQKTFVLVVIAGVVVTSITFYVGEIPVLRASRQTYFQEVKGTVEVLRDDEIIQAHQGMMLKQDDVITTGANGIAFVRYIDDSVTRLSPLAQIKINKLAQDYQGHVDTYVELELLYGRVWSQVINDVDKDSSFVLLANDVVVSSHKKTSFDVENDTKNENIRIKVFDNKIGLSLQNNQNEANQYLQEGYEMFIDERNPAYRKVTVNEDGKNKESWIRINKAKDQEYQTEIEEKNKNRN